MLWNAESLTHSLSLSTYTHPPTYPPIIRLQFTHPSPSALSLFSLHLLLLCVPSPIFLFLSWPLCISLLSSQLLLLLTQSISLFLSLHQQNICFYDHVKYNMVSIKYIKHKKGCVCMCVRCVNVCLSELLYMCGDIQAIQVTITNKNNH